MGGACENCCQSKRKFPTPYQFDFTAGAVLPENVKKFESNFVKTSRYTWYDFLPSPRPDAEALLLQFKRIANIYFLIIGVLQSIPFISPLGAFTAWAPLIVVLGISMLREAYEDFQRYQSDRVANYELKALVLRGTSFVEVSWCEIVVGDIVRIDSHNSFFPADLLLLSSSSEGGTVFIETASLDGEKNLKPRLAHALTQDFQTPEELARLRGRFEGEVPEKSLVNFNAKLLWEGNTLAFKNTEQLLYRGAKLRNTKFINGLAIFTGANSKIMLNAGEAEPKMSQVESKVNELLVLIFVFQSVLCVIAAVLYGVFRNQGQSSHWYIDWPTLSVGADSFLIFFTYEVLLNTMIPISLIVSIEVVKVAQSYFIGHDQLMFSEFRKVGSLVRSASLNEELGQIEYVFSDKTGTLTLNLMEFKIAVIGETMFGDRGLVIKDPSCPPQTNKGFRDDQLFRMLAAEENSKGGRSSSLPSPFLSKQIEIPTQRGLYVLRTIGEAAREYFTILAINHKAVLDVDDKGVETYQGPSPDDIALIDAAKLAGFQFVQATQSTIRIKVHGRPKEFGLLESFPFTSDRKRSTVIVRDEGLIKLYMKGADSVMLSRVAREQPLDLRQELHRFSVVGLRTLLLGMRVVSEDEYERFRKEVLALASDAPPEQYEALVSRLETGLYLLGATAVLDRLQDEVPSTIADLIRASTGATQT